MIKLDLLGLAITDFFRIKGKKYDNGTHIRTSLSWLNRAQDNGIGGGVSSWYGIFSGWGEPYIETTGYIISTYLESYHYFKDRKYLNRATEMANFLVSVQLENGGFKTYLKNKNNTAKPTIFNTGQDLIGIVDIYNETRIKSYYKSIVRAADFLVNSIDEQGRWSMYSYDGKGHSYDSRVAYSLLKAYFVTKNKKYKEVAIKNLKWVMKQQTANGWFLNTELPPPNPRQPYTHTIAYTIEGLLFSGLLIKDSKMINSAKLAADAVLKKYKKNKFIPATFDSQWMSNDRYSCLTGDAQMSTVWSLLYLQFKEKKYIDSVININEFLKTVSHINNQSLNIRGSVAGSFPIYGDLLKNKGYCRMSLINWAVKFYTDALLLEQLIKNKTNIKYIGQ